MIKLDELFKDVCKRDLAKTSDYLKSFSKFEPKDAFSEETKDFRSGLHIGFNYALAMIQEELGEDVWKNKKTDIPMVIYYSSLINLKHSLS